MSGTRIGSPESDVSWLSDSGSSGEEMDAISSRNDSVPVKKNVKVIPSPNEASTATTKKGSSSSSSSSSTQPLVSNNTLPSNPARSSRSTSIASSVARWEAAHGGTIPDTLDRLATISTALGGRRVERDHYLVNKTNLAGNRTKTQPRAPSPLAPRSRPTSAPVARRSQGGVGKRWRTVMMEQAIDSIGDAVAAVEARMKDQGRQAGEAVQAIWSEYDVEWATRAAGIRAGLAQLDSEARAHSRAARNPNVMATPVPAMTSRGRSSRAPATPLIDDPSTTSQRPPSTITRSSNESLSSIAARLDEMESKLSSMESQGNRSRAKTQSIVSSAVIVVDTAVDAASVQLQTALRRVARARQRELDDAKAEGSIPADVAAHGRSAVRSVNSCATLLSSDPPSTRVAVLSPEDIADTLDAEMTRELESLSKAAVDDSGVSHEGVDSLVDRLEIIAAGLEEVGDLLESRRTRMGELEKELKEELTGERARREQGAGSIREILDLITRRRLEA